MSQQDVKAVEELRKNKIEDNFDFYRTIECIYSPFLFFIKLVNNLKFICITRFDSLKH